MDWELAKLPFTQNSLDHLNNISIQKDIYIMTKYCNLREICLRNFIIANKVLLKGANMGLTLYEIGCILYRDGDDEVTVI